MTFGVNYCHDFLINNRVHTAIHNEFNVSHYRKMQIGYIMSPQM